MNTIETISMIRLALLFVVVILPPDVEAKMFLVGFLGGTALWQVVESRFLKGLPR